MIYWCHMHSNEDVNMLESYHWILWRSTMNRAAYNLQRHLPLSNLWFPTPLHLTKPRTTKSPSANAHKGEPVKTFPTFRQRLKESAPNTLPISPLRRTWLRWRRTSPGPTLAILAPWRRSIGVDPTLQTSHIWILNGIIPLSAQEPDHNCQSVSNKEWLLTSPPSRHQTRPRWSPQ